MVVVSKPEVVTADMLMTLGKDAAVEVVGGTLVEVGFAGALHGEIASNIHILLGMHVRANKLGKLYSDQTTYVLAGTPEDVQTMRVPDISFIAAANLPDQTPTGYWYQPPDLAVEVVSPHERSGELQARLIDYFEAGTREVWVVYPELAQIVVHHKDGSRTLGKEDTLTSEDLLPGFALKLSDVFA